MRLRTIVGLLVAAVALAVAADGARRPAPRTTAPRRRCSGSAGRRTSRRSTRSSAQDEENFPIWALNWDLLVNFSPDDLTPVARASRRAGRSPTDKKTVTFQLIEGAKWSDGQPITSKDVKYSLEVLGGNGLIFSGYTEQRHHDRDARRPRPS